MILVWYMRGRYNSFRYDPFNYNYPDISDLTFLNLIPYFVFVNVGA
jgi:hypothetical protein